MSHPAIAVVELHNVKTLANISADRRFIVAPWRQFCRRSPGWVKDI